MLNKKTYIILAVILLVFDVKSSFAQNTDLLRIITSIEQIEKQIAQKQLILATPQAAAGKEAELHKQIAELSIQAKSLDHSLEEIATGISLDRFNDNKINTKISWQEEIDELLSPLLSQVKRASSRPREIEKLRTELSDTEELLTLSETAISNLNKLKNDTLNEGKLVEKSTQLIEAWKQKSKSLQAKASILKQKLDQRIGEKKNLSESIEDVFHLFFKSRGKNLIYALIGAFLFWISFKKIHSSIQARNVYNKSFNFRLFNILFLIGSGAGSICVYLIILFFSGDWLLLIISFFILTGILWNSKEAINKCWGESLLLLNLGPVREGERVIYNGIPMKITALNYNATLENPLLDSEPIKIPLKDLLELRSRRPNIDEPWFPTKTGDWILINSSKLANVEEQTFDTVTLKLPGGEHTQISTSSFFSSDKFNISNGFRISVTIGLDYTVQNKIVSEILSTLQEEIKNSINQSKYKNTLNNLRVEFEKPGSSSLDIAIIADFTGEFAKDYDTLRRWINQLALNACTKHGWALPFPQMDIHIKSGNL